MIRNGPDSPEASLPLTTPINGHRQSPIGMSQTCRLRRANAIQELLDFVLEVSAHI
jgi:hypothetical protein